MATRPAIHFIDPGYVMQEATQCFVAELSIGDMTVSIPIAAESQGLALGIAVRRLTGTDLTFSDAEDFRIGDAESR